MIPSAGISDSIHFFTHYINQTLLSWLLVRVSHTSLIQRSYPLVMETVSSLNCLICTETIPPTENHLLTWCGHFWCRACVNKGFSAACEVEDLYPPRCCQQINFTQARHLLDEEVAALYAQKRIEYSSGSRLYCHNVTCQRFLQPNPTGQYNVPCPKCELDTCTRCRSKGHEGGCPSDPEHEIFMHAVAEAGYRQCGNCKRMIEKVSGCNHIV